MEIKNRFKLGVYINLMCMSLLVNATPAQWKIIPSESQLTFTATQNGAPVVGEFKHFTGNIAVDTQDLKNSSLDIIVDINSLSASYAELKDTLITADWFNAKLFPNAEFKSQQIVKTGENQYKAEGTLTIRDKTVPVTLHFTGIQPNPKKGAVEGSAIIKRSQFGVGQGEWAGTDQVKDEVTVNFKVSGVSE